MRYFLGFDLDAPAKLAIDSWRDKALPAFDKPVPAKNFHLTSVFLGQCRPAQLEKITEAIENHQIGQFAVRLDLVGYFSKPRALWLGSSESSAIATDANHWLTEVAIKAGIGIPKRPYTPHVTIVRNVKYNPPSPLIEPDFTLKMNTLCLFESVSGVHGVQYPVRYSWPLLPQFHRS